jgi:hypothetical protein
MKKLYLFFAAMLLASTLSAGQLVLIPTGSMAATKEVFRMSNLKVNYYDDHYIIATASATPAITYTLLDGNAWQEPATRYYLLRHHETLRDEYRAAIAEAADILFDNEHMMVVRAHEGMAQQLYPVVHGGIVPINDREARLPSTGVKFTAPQAGSRSQDIIDMLNAVNLDSLQAKVQTLQDFGTRNCLKTGGIAAQNWIYDKFASYGLSVELHDFYMWGDPASDNVIATLPGTLFPDEYVVLGAHYDSYAGGDYEPGADDNATGTAGILEAARIMSQYSFDRTIIFACWSGEEYGLYGSDAWATEAAQAGMDILGYFNIDMAGYLEPGDEIHTDMIAPSSAEELVQFYIDVCAVYLPDFPIYEGGLIGGDSDHTSFNQNGYMGIFPFEDSQNYSPYIHTPNDLIGPSVNNFEQHATFTKATLASVASMASALPSPANLTGMAGDGEVILNWTGVDDVDHYNIYRNGETTPYATTGDVSYTDTGVENGSPYSYYVTAIFLGSGEESGPSNMVTVIPMPPIALPFFDDYETNAPYWTVEGGWGLREGTYHSPTHSLTESPLGNYDSETESTATLRAIDLSEGVIGAVLSFWTRYDIETNYDYMYLEVSTDGNSWDQLAVWTGLQSSWSEKSYSLDSYVGEVNVIIRFRFTSDNYIEKDGMVIDDFMIDIDGVGLDENPSASARMAFSPNPASGRAQLWFDLPSPADVLIRLVDMNGRTVRTITRSQFTAGSHSLEIDLGGLPEGIYEAVLTSATVKGSVKVIVKR